MVSNSDSLHIQAPSSSQSPSSSERKWSLGNLKLIRMSSVRTLLFTRPQQFTAYMNSRGFEIHPHEFSTDPLPLQAHPFHKAPTVHIVNEFWGIWNPSPWVQRGPSFSQGPNSSQRKWILGDLISIPMSSARTLFLSKPHPFHKAPTVHDVSEF